MAHDLDGARHLVGGGHEVIHIYIGLEADLPVAEEDEVLSFAVGLVFPSPDIIALSTLPLVVAAPLVGVGIPVGAACEAVGLHVAGVVGGVVPEGADVGGVMGLPVVVDLDDLVENLS